MTAPTQAEAILILKEALEHYESSYRINTHPDARDGDTVDDGEVARNALAVTANIEQAVPIHTIDDDAREFRTLLAEYASSTFTGFDSERLIKNIVSFIDGKIEAPIGDASGVGPIDYLDRYYVENNWPNHQVKCGTGTRILYSTKFGKWDAMLVAAELRTAFFDGRYIGQKEAALQATEPEWISVKDRLPASEQRVIYGWLNVLGNHRTSIGFYAAEKAVCADAYDNAEDHEYDEATDSYWIASGWYEDSAEGEYFYRSTDALHWMPLPAAPSPLDAKEQS